MFTYSLRLIGSPSFILQLVKRPTSSANLHNPSRSNIQPNLNLLVRAVSHVDRTFIRHPSMLNDPDPILRNIRRKVRVQQRLCILARPRRDRLVERSKHFLSHRSLSITSAALPEILVLRFPSLDTSTGTAAAAAADNPSDSLMFWPASLSEDRVFRMAALGRWSRASCRFKGVKPSASGWPSLGRSVIWLQRLYSSKKPTEHGWNFRKLGGL